MLGNPSCDPPPLHHCRPDQVPVLSLENASPPPPCFRPPPQPRLHLPPQSGSPFPRKCLVLQPRKPPAPQAPSPPRPPGPPPKCFLIAFRWFGITVWSPCGDLGAGLRRELSWSQGRADMGVGGSGPLAQLQGRDGGMWGLGTSWLPLGLKVPIFYREAPKVSRYRCRHRSGGAPTQAPGRVAPRQSRRGQPTLGWSTERAGGPATQEGLTDTYRSCLGDERGLRASRAWCQMNEQARAGRRYSMNHRTGQRQGCEGQRGGWGRACPPGRSWAPVLPSWSLSIPLCHAGLLPGAQQRSGGSRCRI